MLKKISFLVIVAHLAMWSAGETPRTLKERVVARWQAEGAARSYMGGGWGNAR